MCGKESAANLLFVFRRRTTIVEGTSSPNDCTFVLASNLSIAISVASFIVVVIVGVVVIVVVVVVCVWLVGCVCVCVCV